MTLGNPWTTGDPPVLVILLIGASILCLSYLGVGLMRSLATKRQLLAIPEERSSHQVATPTGGGVVIAIIAILGAALVRIMNSNLAMPGLEAFLIASIFVAAVGFLDDLYTLPVSLRFGVQAAAAVAVMLSVGVFQKIGLPTATGLSLGWFGYPLTFLWIVGLINAYNFMDGIDGNAGGIGVAAGSMWTLTAWRLGEPLLAVLGVLVVVTCLGFLGHNWHPARIFMGDVGSTFLGFTFAALPLLAQHRSLDARLPLVGALIVAPCIWDATYTFLGRLERGEPLFEAHRAYLYQRLASIGYPHWAGAGLYFALTLALGMCGMLYLWVSNTGAWLLLAVAAALLMCQVAVVVVEERRRTV